MADAYVASRPQVRWKGGADARFGANLLDCSLNLPAHGMDCCELRLNDWGQRSGTAGRLFDDIALGDALELTFAGSSAPSFRGEVTGLELHFGGGAPRLTLLAEDALHRLARQRRSKTYVQQSLADVVATLANEAGLESSCDERASGTWHQLNETDLGFLRRLATGFDLPIRLRDGRRLEVRAFEQGEPVELDLALAPPTTLRLLADLNRQTESLSLNGFDLGSGAAVEGHASSLEPRPSGTTAADSLASLSWPSGGVVADPPALNQGLADAYARAAFARAAGRHLRGELVCEGDPKLVPGASLRLRNAGERFDGDYGVWSCAHRFDLQHGYRTLARLSRGAIS